MKLGEENQTRRRPCPMTSGELERRNIPKQVRFLIHCLNLPNQ